MGPVLYSISFFRKEVTYITVFISTILTLIVPSMNNLIVKKELLGTHLMQYNLTNHAISAISIFLCFTYILMSFKRIMQENQNKLTQRNIELIKNKRELLKSKKIKDEFYALITHDIRTPIIAIERIALLIQSTHLSKNDSEYLSAIQNSTKKLSLLVNDFMDMSKLESGQFNLNKEPIQLEIIFNDLKILFNDIALEKNNNLLIEIDPKINLDLLGDALRIHQIIVNLLGNALKFTQNGTINLKARLLSQSENHQKIEFIVEDNGIGIEKNYIKDIFKKYTQENTQISRQYGGSGLGLNICKKLIDLMGGTIDIVSNKNIGTKISFELSLKMNKPYENQRSIKNIKILLVEDDQTNMLLNKYILEKNGAIVFEAKNGIEAIKFIEKNEVDIILMDIQMPEMNGLEASYYIKNQIKSNIPIIGLSANYSIKDIKKGKENGFSDFCLKPIDDYKITKKIIENLDR
jgi:signal transduction histidine kinase/CheY-like chemotaxis protein